MKLRRFILALGVLLSGAPGLAAEGGIVLSSPVGGWRNGALQEEREAQIVAAYPKPPVDRGGQRNRTLIEGELRRAGNDRKPGRFIVNGIDMPLYTDEQGRFVKPWAFGPGSNNVEIVAPNGSRQRVQFYENHAGKTSAKLRVVLG